MKTTAKIMAILWVFSIVSCELNSKNENTDVTVCPFSHPADGKWNLTNVSQGFSGTVEIKKGNYIWYVNTEKQEIKVVSNITNNNQMPLKAGINKVQFTDTTLIYGQQNNKYDYYLKDSKLYVTDKPEVDGVAYTFERD